MRTPALVPTVFFSSAHYVADMTRLCVAHTHSPELENRDASTERHGLHAERP